MSNCQGQICFHINRILRNSKKFVSCSAKNTYEKLISEPLWRAAVNQFENSLGPAERRIAGKLRSQLRNMHGNTLQLLQEFKRYKELIKRPSIQRELMAERESLLGKLSEYIDKERKSFTNLGPNRYVNAKWYREGLMGKKFDWVQSPLCVFKTY